MRWVPPIEANTSSVVYVVEDKSPKGCYSDEFFIIINCGLGLDTIQWVHHRFLNRHKIAGEPASLRIILSKATVLPVVFQEISDFFRRSL